MCAEVPVIHDSVAEVPDCNVAGPVGTSGTAMAPMTGGSPVAAVPVGGDDAEGVGPSEVFVDAIEVVLDVNEVLVTIGAVEANEVVEAIDVEVLDVDVSSHTEGGWGA